MTAHMSWNPHARPLHRLILSIDVLAIAWRRFRTLSERAADLEQLEWVATNMQLQREHHEIVNGVVDKSADAWLRLLEGCIAESAAWGVADSEAMLRCATDWFRVRRQSSPQRHPLRRNMVTRGPDELSEERQDRRWELPTEWERYLDEEDVFHEASLHRQSVVLLLSRHGEQLTDDIRRRDALFALPWTDDNITRMAGHHRLIALLASEGSDSHERGSSEDDPANPPLCGVINGRSGRGGKATGDRTATPLAQISVAPHLVTIRSEVAKLHKSGITSVGAILDFMRKAEGKDLRIAVAEELRVNGFRKGKQKLRRTDVHVIKAALRTIYQPTRQATGS